MQKWCYEIEILNKMGQDLGFSPIFFFFFFDSDSFRKNGLFRAKYIRANENLGHWHHFCPCHYFQSCSSILIQMSCPVNWRTDIEFWFHGDFTNLSMSEVGWWINQFCIFSSYLLEKHWTVQVFISQIYKILQ